MGIPRGNRPDHGYLRDAEGAWHDRYGAVVSDPGELVRLKRLAVPPAWTNVWATDDPGAAVQATGSDGRGRTQYRYLAEATARAASDKFMHVLDFARQLPRIRAEVNAALSYAKGGRAITLPTATASIVRLLDLGLFRVGTERYQRDNHTYGLTTLTRADATVHGDTLRFDYIGKEHRHHDTTVADHDSARVVRQLLAQHAPPETPLFVVHGDRGTHHVTSADVNAYLHRHSGAPATAKMFRTWGGHRRGRGGHQCAEPPTPASRRLTDKAVAVSVAASLLGDTRPVTCASCIHPRVFDPALGDTLRGLVGVAAAAAAANDALTVMREPAFQLTLATVLSEGQAS